MTTRLSLLLLMVILCTVTLGRAQDATSTATTGARPFETGEHLQMSVSPLDSGQLTTSHWTGDLFANIAGVKANDDLLSRYSDLSALPLKERKPSFRNASSKDKSNLWRTHLALLLVKGPELNEWQKAIILTAMSLVTPEYFEVRSNSTAWQVKVGDLLRSLDQEILGAFSFEDGARIFATFGDDIDAAKRTLIPWGSVSLYAINYRERNEPGPYAHNRFSRQDLLAQGGSCDCSLSSDWCPISGYRNSTGCSGTQSGCVTLWSYPCSGVSCQ